MYDPSLDTAVARWLAAPPAGQLPPRPVLDRARAGYAHPHVAGRGFGEFVAALDFDAAGSPAAEGRPE